MHPSSRWSRWGRTAIISTIAAAIAWFAFGLRREVPLLDWFDLGIHEAGHLLAAPLPEVAMFIAGSLAQVAFPIVMAAYFAMARGDRAAAGLCLVWAGASARDVSVYAADAISQSLPLVGGGQHDWAYILGHFDALHLTARIASGIEAGGAFLVVVGFSVLAVAAMPAPSGAVAPPRRNIHGEDPWAAASRLPFRHQSTQAAGSPVPGAGGSD